MELVGKLVSLWDFDLGLLLVFGLVEYLSLLGLVEMLGVSFLYVCLFGCLMVGEIMLEGVEDGSCVIIVVYFDYIFLI